MKFIPHSLPLLFLCVFFIVIILVQQDDVLGFDQLEPNSITKFKIQDLTRPFEIYEQSDIGLTANQVTDSGNIYYLFLERTTLNNHQFQVVLGMIDHVLKKKRFIVPVCLGGSDRLAVLGLFVTKDDNETIYIVDRNRNQIFTIDWESANCTLIAGNGEIGYSGDGGSALNATFMYPCCIHVEKNVIYIADSYNNAIRAISNGIIRTLVRAHATVNGIYIAPNMDMYFVVDNRVVYQRSYSTMKFSLVAGNYSLKPGFSGDGGPATNAQFSFTDQIGLLVLNSQLFITDTGNNRIRSVDLSTGIVNTFAGETFNNNVYTGFGNGDGGPATRADIVGLVGSLSYHDGYVYISDHPLRSIRRINLNTGIVSSIFGMSENSSPVGLYLDGMKAIDVNLQNPTGLSLDHDDNLLVSDPKYGYLINITREGNMFSLIFPKEMQYFSDVYGPFLQNIESIACRGNDVTIVSESGYIQQLDSNRKSQMIGGPLTPSRFSLSQIEKVVLNSPKGIHAYNGTVYISDSGNHRIIKVDSRSGKVTLVAGTGIPGYSDGIAVNSQLNSPTGIYVSGNNLWIADSMNHRIRRVDLISGYISTIAGSGILGFSGDSSNATLAQLNYPTYVTEHDNIVYFTDTNNNVIRQIDLSTNIITKVAGTGIQGFNFDGADVLETHLANPRGLLIQDGSLYFCDTGNLRIRYFTFSDRLIYTMTGNGKSGPNAISIVGFNQATFNFPSHLSAQCNNVQCDFYLADTLNFQIRLLTTGSVDNFMGRGIKGNSLISDNQLPNNVYLNSPECVFVDPVTKKIYVSDTGNNRILVSGLGYNPIVELFIGRDGDGGKVEYAQIIATNVAVSPKSGNVYVTESEQNRIRKISPDGSISTIGGNGIFGISSDGYQANISTLASPKGILINEDDEVIFTELGTSKIRKITKLGKLITLAGNGAVGFSGDGSNALSCNLNSPSHVTSSSTDLFITDSQNFRIRRVSLTDGLISTIAGNGQPSTIYSNSIGPATNHSISPGSLVVTRENTIYFVDANKRNIKKLTPYCDEGYHLFQFRTCYPICFGKIYQIDPTVCSGRGTCQSPNSCSCSDSLGFGGNECQIPICFGILGNETLVCSNSNGTCIDANNCQCNSGFSGKECQIPICFGKMNADSCGGNRRGECITKDTCQCHNGFTGPQCELFTCQGISEKDSHVCSGNGQCTNGYCSCMFGYSGDNCQDKTNLYIIIGVTVGILLMIAIISVISIISISIFANKYKKQQKILLTDGLLDEKLLSFSDLSNDSHSVNYEESFFIPLEKLGLHSTIRKIGSGNSSVFRTVWNGHSVAVKVYDMNNMDIGEEEFMSEVRVLSSLRHPNIVTFYGFSTSPTKRYIVMELMESDLQKLISALQKKTETKTLKQKIELLINVASGVEYLHNLSPKKIIHRDLKPANILYQNGNCKLCDFGLSKAMGQQQSAITNNIGTMYYSPPEIGGVIQSETVTAIDIYSLAIIMWQILFEILDPYNYISSSILEKLNLVDQVVYPSLFHLHKHICDNHTRPTIPFSSLETCQEWSNKFGNTEQAPIVFELCEMIKKCWAHFPRDRPSIGEVLEKLQDLQSQLEP